MITIVRPNTQITISNFGKRQINDIVTEYAEYEEYLDYMIDFVPTQTIYIHTNVKIESSNIIYDIKINNEYGDQIAIIENVTTITFYP